MNTRRLKNLVVSRLSLILSIGGLLFVLLVAVGAGMLAFGASTNDVTGDTVRVEIVSVPAAVADETAIAADIASLSSTDPYTPDITRFVGTSADIYYNDEPAVRVTVPADCTASFTYDESEGQLVYTVDCTVSSVAYTLEFSVHRTSFPGGTVPADMATNPLSYATSVWLAVDCARARELLEVVDPEASCNVYSESTHYIAKTGYTLGQTADYKYVADSGKAYIYEYLGAGGAVTIPATINGLAVTKILDFTFAYEKAVTSVVISEGVLDIGSDAFGASGITSATLPQGLKTIGNSAFANTNITAITIPDSVTTIGPRAFFSLSLSEVAIPASVTSIGDMAFGYCIELYHVEFASTLPAFGEAPFRGCDSLAPDIDSVELSENALNRELYDMDVSNYLHVISSDAAPDGGQLNTSIEPSRFAGTKLHLSWPWHEEYTLTVPNDCTVDYDPLDDGTGYICNSKYLIGFTDGGIQYVLYVVYEANTLIDSSDVATDINIGEETAFCTYWIQLMSRRVDETTLNSFWQSYEEMNSDSSYCDSILDSSTIIRVKGRNVLSLEEDGEFEYAVYPNEVYITKYLGDGGAVTVPGTYKNKPITTVTRAVFGCKSIIDSVTFSEGIMALDDSVFCHCEGVTSITLPESLRYIGFRCFDACYNLDTITIPLGVTLIDHGEYDGSTMFEETTVRCYENSAAHAYCVEYSIPFELVGKVLPVPVQFAGVEHGTQATLTCTRQGSTDELSTSTGYVTDMNGGCAYLDMADLVAGQKYDIVLSKPGYTSYTITGFDPAANSIPTDVALYAGDVDNSGTVDLNDVAKFAIVYGSLVDGANYTNLADYDDNGEIELADVNYLVLGYLKTNVVKEAE